jgi:hypothetical protein
VHHEGIAGVVEGESDLKTQKQYSDDKSSRQLKKKYCGTGPLSSKMFFS